MAQCRFDWIKFPIQIWVFHRCLKSDIFTYFITNSSDCFTNSNSESTIFFNWQTEKKKTVLDQLFFFNLVVLLTLNEIIQCILFSTTQTEKISWKNWRKHLKNSILISLLFFKILFSRNYQGVSCDLFWGRTHAPRMSRLRCARTRVRTPNLKWSHFAPALSAIFQSFFINFSKFFQQFFKMFMVQCVLKQNKMF